MSYQVLARKLRPASFEALVGQEHVVRALVHALESDRVHHAYLFTGTRGVGKTTIARLLAKALNCERGVGANPCGTCGACRDIAAGRFADLIEVDAASRTGVDATRDLLDNAQYRPSRGRYKVYLIDEVHMLSQASFNALLKTLEEPPEHVKFLLATTDPKKVPITVLSRCLQFQLKNLLPERIASYLEEILVAEAIEFEQRALEEIARAARGSMRDALSLTDQAIAYGGGRLAADDVAAMLGTVDREELGRLLELIVAQDGPGLLAYCAALAEQAADFVEILRGLLVALHDIAVVQTVGGPGRHDERFVHQLAQSIAPETTQLYYQIVLLGLRDLHLAPDPQCGFEMVMMRLLAFEPLPPDDGSSASPPSARSAPAAAAKADLAPSQGPGGGVAGRSGDVRQVPQRARAVPAPATTPSSAWAPGAGAQEATKADDPSGDSASVATGRPWHEIVEGLRLSGVARMIVEHSVPQHVDDGDWTLCLDRAHDTLLNETQTQAIARALDEALAQRGDLRRPVSLRIVPGVPAGETPAQRRTRVRRERHAQAVTALEQDQNVRTLIEEFGAELNLDSVRPVQVESTRDRRRAAGSGLADEGH